MQIRRSSYEKHVEDDAGPAEGVLRELRHGAGRQITAPNQGWQPPHDRSETGNSIEWSTNAGRNGYEKDGWPSEWIPERILHQLRAWEVISSTKRPTYQQNHQAKRPPRPETGVGALLCALRMCDLRQRIKQDKTAWTAWIASFCAWIWNWWYKMA